MLLQALFLYDHSHMQAHTPIYIFAYHIRCLYLVHTFSLSFSFLYWLRRSSVTVFSFKIVQNKSEFISLYLLFAADNQEKSSVDTLVKIKPNVITTTLVNKPSSTVSYRHTVVESPSDVARNPSLQSTMADSDSETICSQLSVENSFNNTGEYC